MSEEIVMSTIRKFLKQVKKTDRPFEADTKLYGEGIGLDSLETAELSAVLEDRLGTDPYTAGELPQTVGDILDFYKAPTP